MCFFFSLARVFCKVGDGTNFVLVFAGALLDAAEELLRMVSLVVREQSKPESCQEICFFLNLAPYFGKIQDSKDTFPSYVI